MNIIVVDDEKNALENMQHTLSELPEVAHVELFDNGEDALSYLAGHSAYAALLDIEMRGMGGMELAKRVREIRPETGVIFITGYSQYALEAMEMHANGYIVKPAKAERVRAELLYLREGRPQQPTGGDKLRVQCFGNFEVFAEGKPLEFRYTKTKELFAYLIDRKGALCTNNEIMAALWEDEVKGSYFKNIRVDLLRTLPPDIFAKQWGKLGVMPDAISCDYYDWMRGDPAAINAYTGEYMSQYAWAEATLGAMAFYK